MLTYTLEDWRDYVTEIRKEDKIRLQIKKRESFVPSLIHHHM